MIDAIGIVNFEDRDIHVQGLSDYRSIAAMSFMGRYRIIDFVISNMINSGINKIKVLINEQPRSLIDHLQAAQYNINYKHGYLDLLYPGNRYGLNDIYFHDVYLMKETLEEIRNQKASYIVIAPSYSICRINFEDVIKAHQESGADVTCVYKKIDNGKKEFLGCKRVSVDVTGRITSIENNIGLTNKMNILSEIYVMNRETYIDLISEASKVSPLFSFINVLSHVLGDIKVHGYEYSDYLVSINSLESYYRVNMEMIDGETAEELFSDDWPIYTKTNDSPPAFYAKSAHVKNCLIANGCEVYGDLENCILGRAVKIGEGCNIKNSLILPNAVIQPYAHIENAIIDKYAEVSNKREIIGSSEKLAYVRRRDKV